MNTKPLIAANWKMHKTIKEAEQFFAEFQQYTFSPEIDILIAGSFPLLPKLVELFQNSPVHIAAQNMHPEECGAFTGEVSPVQLRDIGCTHVIIGHSERRHVFGEQQDFLNKKLSTAEKFDLIPLYCVGETEQERNAGKAKEVVQRQIQEGIAQLSANYREKLIVAYEPVWAIGTGQNASPKQAEDMHAFIRTLIPEKTTVLYGGSVKPENANDLFQKPSIHGFLVGGASLQASDFAKIILASSK